MPEALKLQSEDRTASLVLRFVDSSEGSVAVDVEVAAEGFTGSAESVHFQRSALNAFEAELLRFERERAGTASVQNLGVVDASNEFTLALTSRTGGHALAEVSVQRFRYSDSRLAPLKVAVSFKVDGGEVGSFVRDWQRLFNGSAGPSAT